MNIGNQSVTSRAISTTAVVAVIVIIILAGVVVYYVGFVAPSSSSTTSPSTTSPSSSTSATGFKSTIIYGTTDAVATTLDPADAYDYFGVNMIDNLGAPLVDFAPGTTDTSAAALQPALATHWTVSADGLTYTFVLRSGLKYDDGTPFNSTDVAYSFNRGIALADAEGPIVAIPGYGLIKSIATPNATTVVFHMTSPFSAFLSMMTFSGSYPVNPHKAPMPAKVYPGAMTGIVNYTAGNPAASNPNGLGPYTLTEWTRSGTKDIEMTLTANPNYWNYPNYPKTKTIVIKFYPDATSLAAAIRSGDVDFAYRQFTTSDIASLQVTSGLKVYPSPGAFIQYLVINEHIAPFNNVLVRQAIAAAINRTDLVNTVFAGTAVPLYSQIPVGMTGHIDAFKTAFGAGPNYATTVADLAKAGYNATHPLPVNIYFETTGHYPQSSDQALVLSRDLDASGVISVTLTGVDWPTMSANRAAGNMPAFIMGWYPDYIDPTDYTYPFFQASASSWLNYGYNSTTMNNLLAESVSATSAAAAIPIYGQIQTLTATDVPIIPLYQGGANCCGVVAKSTVGGIYLDVTLIFRLYPIYETTS